MQEIDLFAENMSVTREYVTGFVKTIFFQNPTNFYKVILIKITETNTQWDEKEIVVTGSFGQIREEEAYQFYGKIIDHPKYGVQFQVETYQQVRPSSESGLVAYLSGENFSGIGKKTAEKIVELLGVDAIDKILDNPDVLKEVPNLNAKKRQVIVTQLQISNGMEKVLIGLNEYGFGSQLALQIYEVYQAEAIEKIQENPYQLVEDIEGIGFKRADQLAEQLGFEADNPFRIQGGLLFILSELSFSTGDTFVATKPLVQETVSLLENSRPKEIRYDQVAEVLIEMIREQKIVEDAGSLYLPSLYFAEWGISTSIQRLMKRKDKIHYPEKDLDKEIKKIEKAFDIVYDDSQIEAIKAAVQSPLFILTGGPGTGKTTVINGIVHLFARLNDLSLDINDYHNSIFPILLAAPTGRAAKRMGEATDLPSSTIHRMLGLTGREKNPEVAARELEGGLLIVDEMSMVDTWLANTLFKAIPTNMQVILVGDKDQLPSVGPGQVLDDLLASQMIPMKELSQIFRQAEGSSIISLAHEIKKGIVPADLTKNQQDRSFIFCHAHQLSSVIEQVVEKAVKKGFTAQDIQVLAPMYRGVAGINQLNKMLQEIFNGTDNGKRKRKEVQYQDQVYRVGDKVLQLANSPESNVFNGDMGEIVGILSAKETEDKTEQIVIQFDQNEVTYKRNEWHNITLAYCCSIHKAQGSEFKMVILPMLKQYQRMLKRNLLYTALTRSKALLIMCGEPEAFAQAITQEADVRHTKLIEKILTDYDKKIIEKQPQTVAISEVKEQKEVYTTENKKKEMETIGKSTKRIENELDDFVLTNELVSLEKVDPMIGMESVSIVDFIG